MKEAKCSEKEASWAVENTLHLQHGFHEREFLPENDPVRYTVSTAARKEILRLLLALNYARHAEAVAAGLVDQKGKLLKKKDSPDGAPFCPQSTSQFRP